MLHPLVRLWVFVAAVHLLRDGLAIARASRRSELGWHVPLPSWSRDVASCVLAAPVAVEAAVHKQQQHEARRK